MVGGRLDRLDVMARDVRSLVAVPATLALAVLAEDEASASRNLVR